MTEKKPKKFPGMKIQPKFGPKKNAATEYKDLVQFDGLPRPNMTQWQLKTFNKFIQVKEGETHEQWSKRTACRRVLNEDDFKNLGKINPAEVKRAKRKNSLQKTSKEFLRLMQTERDFDYLKYYAIILNYYSIKYNVYKEWLEVGFYFYEGTPFTKTTFENVCVLSFCNSKKVFNHFLKKGWIIPIIKNKVTRKNTIKQENTDLYSFHKHFINKITYLYRVLNGICPLRVGGPMSHKLSTDAKKLIYEMNDEIMEIKSGKKQPEDILN